MILVKNRKINDFIQKDHFLAGMILQGWEVKSILEKEADISGSYITIKNNEVFLIGAHINARPSVFITPDPIRERKLLLNKSEIRKLKQETQKGLRLIPGELIYQRKIKLKFSVCQKIRKGDRREVEKERESKREVKSYENH